MEKKTILTICKIFLSCLIAGTIRLGYSQESISTEETLLFQTIELSDDELSEDEIGGSDNITGFLQSSRDVFLRTAAFNFGQARFKVRGYDSREGTIMINGISMNKIFDGRPQWSNWGGLNDVLRNQTFTNGIEASDYAFGNLLGVTNFKTRASEYRAGENISFAITDGSYQERYMASYFSGVQKRGWSFAVSASRRVARRGFVDGTSYNAWSAFLSLEKQINQKQSLNFTAVFTPNRRGKSSPNTQEVYDIKGIKYNSYWGIQEGEKRNSRIKEVSEPFFMLTHYWQLNMSTNIQSTVAYQKGHIGNSRLGYFNAPNPDPTYYKKLPSYNLRFLDNQDEAGAYQALKKFQNEGQIDWRDLYQTNRITRRANYYLYEDRNEDMTLTLNTRLEKQFNSKLNFRGIISFVKFNSLNYAKVLDLLGENGFTDVDAYADESTKQNDLNNPNRQVSNGDSFSYRYKLFSTKINAFSQVKYVLKKLELFGAFSIERTIYQREGLYKNGAYPNNSFGAGRQKTFTTMGIKTGILYKFSGRHLLYSNMAYFSKAPNLKNIFANVRIRQEYSPGLSEEKRVSVDLNYQYRFPKLKSRFTVYYASLSDIIENSFTFADGLRGDEADFVAQILTGIKKRHIGIEFGIEFQITASIKLNAVAAIGEFIYTNNPELYIQSDQFRNEDRIFGKAYLKNYKLGGSPQRAYSVGFEYRDPNYWWCGVNANILSHNYIQISPLLRTNNFFLDGDGIPFINKETGNQISQEDVTELLRQEKFKNTFLINFIGGKSWKIKEKYIGLFVSVNNVLGQIYKTGGFEQSRNANYEKLKRDKNLENPLFGSKYWYGRGTTYYLILSLRF